MPKKPTNPQRALFTKDQIDGMTSEELMRAKLTEPERALLREIVAERDEEIRFTVELIRIEAAPYHAELAAAGVTTWELANSHGKSPKYDVAIPIMLKHLQMPYSDTIKDSIARSLAVPLPAVRKAWPILVREYRNAPTGMGYRVRGAKRQRRLGAKDGLAVALSVAATVDTLPELIELASDPANGESRVLLLFALRRSKSDIAKQAIARLVSDPVLTKEISAWKKI